MGVLLGLSECHVLIVLLLSVTVRGRMLNSKYVGVWRAAKCKNTFTTMSKFINFNAPKDMYQETMSGVGQTIKQ